jgi:hypothetical protein
VRVAISGESLADIIKRGAAGLFVIEDGEPSSGASFFIFRKSDFVLLPFIMFDDIIQLKRFIRDDEMIGQL